MIEVILDRRLAPACDEENLLDPVGNQFLDHVLHDRLTRHRQHFLGLGLRRREEARTQARHGNHCALNHPLTITTATLLYWQRKGEAWRTSRNNSRPCA